MRDSERCLEESMQGVAVVSSVATEALAQASGVITLSTSAAFIAVVEGTLKLNNRGMIGFASGIDWKTRQLGGASISTDISVDDQQVLFALHGVSGECNGNIDLDIIEDSGDFANGHSDTINDLVGQLQQRHVDIVNQISEIRSGGVIIKDNRNSGEGFVQLRLEGNGKSLAINIVFQSFGKVEKNLLNLVLGIQQEVVTDVQNIITIGAHSLRAVKVSIQGIAHAGALLASVPIVVWEGLGIDIQTIFSEIVPGGSISQIFNVLASAVTRAVIGTT